MLLLGSCIYWNGLISFFLYKFVTFVSMHGHDSGEVDGSVHTLSLCVVVVADPWWPLVFESHEISALGLPGNPQRKRTRTRTRVRVSPLYLQGPDHPPDQALVGPSDSRSCAQLGMCQSYLSSSKTRVSTEQRGRVSTHTHLCR